MTIKVLIVDPDIGFAVPIKRALELSGDYDVRVFANGRAAVEMVQREPQDIAILDFAIIDMRLAELINELRFVQPELFILTSPRTAADIAHLPSLDAQGSITKPYLARQLIPVIKEAVAAKTRLDTQQTSKRDLQPTLDFLDPNRKQNPRHVEEPVMKPDDTFYRLAKAMYGGLTTRHEATAKIEQQSITSEPVPEPEIPEDATIGELVSGQQTPPSGSTITEPEPDVDLYATRPLVVLEAISNPQVSFEDISLPNFVARIEEAEQNAVSVSPSDFLAQDEPPVSLDDTLPSQGLHPAILPTPAFDELERTQPMGGIVQEQLERGLDESTQVEPLAELEIPSTLPEPQPTPIAVSEEPVANVAAQLTQLTLGSAAEATLVTRGNELVSAAGQLAPRAIAGLVELISTAWETREQTEEDGSTNAIVRYITVPDTGDYLLYSTPTADGMALSMLFPAETPLKVIRKQARELMTALDSVPEPAVDTEVEAARTLISRPTDLKPPEGLRDAIAEQAQQEAAARAAELPRAEGPLAAYTFVWIPQAETIEPEVAGVILDWINTSITKHRWQLDGLEIQPTYVSVQVSIPANETPTASVEILMQETAEQAGNPALWADAYYVVAPGRTVTQQEIANFIEYHRTAQHQDAA